jgi:hypothetical protein
MKLDVCFHEVRDFNENDAICIEHKHESDIFLNLKNGEKIKIYVEGCLYKKFNELSSALPDNTLTLYSRDGKSFNDIDLDYRSNTIIFEPEIVSLERSWGFGCQGYSYMVLMASGVSYSFNPALNQDSLRRHLARKGYNPNDIIGNIQSNDGNKGRSNKTLSLP